MKLTQPVLALAALAACALASTALVQEMMQMPKPAPEHAQIQAGVGEWEGTVTTYLDPSGKPTVESAKETVTSLGGFWVLSQFESKVMGGPYHGSGHFGYDPEKKKHVGTWVDSMSSQIAIMEGEVDPATKALVMRWKGPDPTGKIVPHRSECVSTGDARTETFYMGEGAGTKTMVIEMKRKAGKPTEAGAKR